MKCSLSKFDSRLYDVRAGPLVFEIWRPAAGLLATLFLKALAQLKPEALYQYTVCIYVIHVSHIYSHKHTHTF